LINRSEKQFLKFSMFAHTFPQTHWLNQCCYIGLVGKVKRTECFETTTEHLRNYLGKLTYQWLRKFLNVEKKKKKYTKQL